MCVFPALGLRFIFIPGPGEEDIVCIPGCGTKFPVYIPVLGTKLLYIPGPGENDSVCIPGPEIQFIVFIPGPGDKDIVFIPGPGAMFYLSLVWFCWTCFCGVNFSWKKIPSLWKLKEKEFCRQTIGFVN